MHRLREFILADIADWVAKTYAQDRTSFVSPMNLTLCDTTYSGEDAKGDLFTLPFEVSEKAPKSLYVEIDTLMAELGGSFGFSVIINDGNLEVSSRYIKNDLGLLFEGKSILPVGKERRPVY